MKIEDFFELLKIACSPEAQQDNINKESKAHLAFQEILNDDETIINIINIFQNSQNYTNDILILANSVLYQLFNNNFVEKYSNDMLDQFSLAFLDFIPKFIEYASTFSRAIICFAKKNNYNPKFILPLGQLAFEELLKFDNRTYKFAVDTLNYLIQLYQFKIADENIIAEFYNRIREVSLHIFNPNRVDYSFSSEFISIFISLNINSFDVLFQDLSVLNIFLNILQNPEALNINDTTFIYFDRILYFFHHFIMTCRDNYDSIPKRRSVFKEFTPQLLQILPQFCLFLSIPSFQSNLIVKDVQGRSIFIIIMYIQLFRELESYPTYIENLLIALNCFSQLSKHDIYEFNNNIFNYYNIAFAIEHNSDLNLRSNSSILLDLICQNSKGEYVDQLVDHVFDVFIHNQPNEGIFFILSHIVQNIRNDITKNLVHQYISSLLTSFESFPLHVQFTFIFFAARSIFLLSKEESEKLLQIAVLYIGEAQKDLSAPNSCFHFTFASEIIYNFVKYYNSLPEDLIKPFIELYSLSYSSNSVKCVDQIFNIYPALYEVYQNHVIFESLKTIDCIFSNQNDIYLSSNEEEIVDMNLMNLYNQANHPNPNFPTKDISEIFDNILSSDNNQCFVVQIMSLYSQIIQQKANEYEVVVQSTLNLFQCSNFLYYHEDIVKPLLTFIGDDFSDFLHSNFQQPLFEITIENINTHIKGLVIDDDSFKDIIACTTLLSRLIQALGNSIPPEIISNIYKLIALFESIRNDLPSKFIIFEILASLTFVDKGQNMQNAIDDWINLCLSGVIQCDYYIQLHFFALKIISETFPNRSNDIYPILNAFQKGLIDFKSQSAVAFANKYNFLYNYASYKAPFQYFLQDSST